MVSCLSKLKLDQKALTANLNCYTEEHIRNLLLSPTSDQGESEAEQPKSKHQRKEPTKFKDCVVLAKLPQKAKIMAL